MFVFDGFEPVDYGCGVFPLVEVVLFRDCAVDAVEDVFADFAYTVEDVLPMRSRMFLLILPILLCIEHYKTILYFTFPYYRTLKDIAWLVTLRLLRYLIVKLKPY